MKSLCSRKIGLFLCAAALLFISACGTKSTPGSEEVSGGSGIQPADVADVSDSDLDPDTPVTSAPVNSGDQEDGDGSGGSSDPVTNDEETASNGSESGGMSDPDTDGGKGQPSDSGQTGSPSTGRIQPLDETITVSQGVAYVTNSDAIEVIVNKQRNLNSDYEPEDLVVPDILFSFSGDDPKKQLRKEAARAIEQLFAAAKDDQIELAGVSGYRSYSRQEAIFARNVKTKGEKEARRVSAYPGQSEHQTGLAMDVSSKSVNYELEETFGASKEGKWLAEHAHEYGFIIRYPQDKEHLTGYSYEPWHIRYVGKEIAQEIFKLGLTLEQYAEQQSVPVSTE